MMKNIISLCFQVTFFITFFAAQAAQGAFQIENDKFALLLAADGTVKSLLHKASRQECLAPDAQGKAFWATIAGKKKPSSEVRKIDSKLEVQFGDAALKAIIKLTITDAYVGFRLEQLQGAVDRLTIFQLPLKPREHFGSWLNCMWDEEVAVCLLAANHFTNIGSKREEVYTLMHARAYPKVKLEGCEAALIVSKKTEILDCIDRLEEDYGLPRGVRNRRAPDQKWSYFWPDPTLDNIDRCIEYAQKGGFKQMTISYTAFSKSAGHFPWKDSYPNGIEDLKAVVQKVKAAGISPGLHIHFNKAHKSDPYVTPIPDDRLHKVRWFILAEPIDEEATTITVKENPEGCTLDDRRRILQVGKELISYTEYTAEPPYQFKGCQRGHLSTHVAVHNVGECMALLNVDTRPGFIRFDQNTDIQEETAERIAHLYNTCGFEYIYFDGSEDVHRPFWYNISKAQYEVYRRLRTEPVVAEAAARTHFGWHMLSRSNAYDTVMPEKVKNFCRKRPCKTAVRNAESFTGVNFGWLAYKRYGSKTIGTQPDMIEYVLSRGAAWDCPISLHTNLSNLDASARTPDTMEIIRRWEDVRACGWLTEQQKEQLRNLEQEYILLTDEEGRYELQPYRQIPDVAGGDDSVRAFIFGRKGKVYVVFWHAYSAAAMKLEIPASKVRLLEELEKTINVKTCVDGGIEVTIGPRRYLECLLTEQQVIEAFQNAKLIKR